jgi:hypothetical protein
MTTALTRWHMTTRSTRGVVSCSRASVTIEGRAQHRDFRGLTVRHALGRAERWILARLEDAPARPATP